MQFTTTLSVAFFAALASAHAHNPQHFHHRRQYATNETSIAGGPTTASVPLSTGNSGPAPTGAPTGGAGGGESSVVLTYTLGSGTSTTVVTTTIKHYETATVYATLPSSGEPAGESGVGGEVSAQPTTTLTDTSTSTKYVTVLAASTGAAGDSGSCAPVTVTVALSTVTVTETATPTPDSGAGGAVTSSTPVAILSTQTVQPIPVSTPVSTGAPYGNGTISGVISSTGAPCASVFPSGFLSLTGSAAASPYPRY